MRTEKEVREELERVEKAKKQSQSPGKYNLYTTICETFKWVLGEEE